METSCFGEWGREEEKEPFPFLPNILVLFDLFLLKCMHYFVYNTNIICVNNNKSWPVSEEEEQECH